MAALWGGLLTGPVAWLILLETNYLLAYVACETRQTWFMHLATAVALLLVSAAGWIAWHASPGDLTAAETQSHPLSDETGRQRARWMGLAGVGISIWFVIVIIAMEVPILVLRECQ